MSDGEEIVCRILDIGEVLLTSGAEVSRVEDAIRRLGRRFECSRSDVFVITSSIILTVQTEEGGIHTQTRRIGVIEVDMDRLSRANMLSREFCAGAVSLDEIPARIAQIRQVKRYPSGTRFFMFALISAVFCIFFGGSLKDAAAAFLAGIVLFGITVAGERIRLPSILLSLLSSLGVGFFLVLLLNLGIGDSFDKIAIGTIMLLIPGLKLTTSLRDIIHGDGITGLLGLSEALIKAMIIAVGFACVMPLLGR